MRESRNRRARVPVPRHQPLIDRLDHAAENLNPILLLVVIGLVILDLSVFGSLGLREPSLQHWLFTPIERPASPFTLHDAVGLPQR